MAALPIVVVSSMAIVACDEAGISGQPTAADPAAQTQDVLFSDDGARADPASIWGGVDCPDGSITRVPAGGAPDGAGGEAGAPSPAYRRVTTLIESPVAGGPRCELGRNEHRYGDAGPQRTAALFREGDRRTTVMAARLPASYRLDRDEWQVLMQMKQTQPSANGGGTPVLSLEARGDRWRLMQSTSAGPSRTTRQIWSAPAALGTWTQFAFDVKYSQDPEIGSVEVQADLNADGDFGDLFESSAPIKTYTLKQEGSGGDPEDGIEPGESIPSHLRVGLYHDPDLECPPPVGCAVDIDNVAVLTPSR